MLAGGAFFEHSHRVIAAVWGFLVLFLAICCGKRTLVLDALVWGDCRGGVVAQAVLGGQVVRSFCITGCRYPREFAQIVFANGPEYRGVHQRVVGSDRPQLEESGTPSIHSLAILNAAVIYLQVILGCRLSATRKFIFGRTWRERCCLWNGYLDGGRAA